MDGYNASTAEAGRPGSRFQAPRGLRHPDTVQRLRPWYPFAFFVLLPTLLGALYFLAIASDQYYSDAAFVIRSPGHNNGGTSSNPLASLMQTAGISRSADDTYTVNTYLTSRDALRDLVDHDGLRAVFNPPGADFLARFPHPFGDDSFEALYKYFKSHVQADYDTTSGVTNLEVRTFSPEDSQRIANALLASGERLLNRLNDRALHNAVDDAEREVKRMQQQELDVESRMAAFRNEKTVIDPQRESQIMLMGMASLQQQLAVTQTLITELQHNSPASPLLQSAERRAAALQAQIQREQTRVTGQDSMVPRISAFDSLLLEQEVTGKGLASAISSLETARMSAQRQQLYLDRVVQPNIPDQSLYPRRWLAIGMVFVTFLSLYLIGKLLISGVREHNAH